MSELKIDRHLYTTRPDPEGRLPKEMAVYDLLERLDIPFIRVDHEAAMTIEACQGVDELLGLEICKNLFLCNAQKTKFYLLLMPGGTEYMEKYLGVTPGSATLLGLMHDPDRQVQLIIDEEVTAQEEFGCHPCINTSSLKLRTKDVLEKLIPALGHEPVFVKL